MPPDLVPYSHEWWLQRLGARLDARQAPMRQMQAYYDGAHPLLFASQKFRDAFGALFASWSDNFCALVVDAVEERLTINGFRIPVPDGQGDAKDAETGDAAAWRLWQANHLDADSHLAHQEALVKGAAYISVWDNPDDGSTPLITVEDALEVCVDLEPGNRRKRRAALKRWVDDDRTICATLYLPDEITKWQATEKAHTDGSWPQTLTWTKREVTGEEWPLVNRLGVVPVIPLHNRPRLGGIFESEIEQVRPVQDAINKEVADMLVASEFAAFRQRWATGIDIPEDENGNPIEPFKAAVDRIWMVPPSEPGEAPAQFGEFDAADLNNYVKAVEMLTMHLAARSRTPAHYFLNAGIMPSGETLKASEAGLVSKARGKQRPWGEAWEEALRLAFALLDDPRAKVMDSETMWGNPETRTQAETTDAAIKMQSLGVPQEALWAYIGATPQEITRWRQMRMEEAMLVGNAFGAPPPPTPAVGGAGVPIGPRQSPVPGRGAPMDGMATDQPAAPVPGGQVTTAAPPPGP